jgi:hypothetical protein
MARRAERVNAAGECRGSKIRRHEGRDLRAVGVNNGRLLWPLYTHVRDHSPPLNGRACARAGVCVCLCVLAMFAFASLRGTAKTASRSVSSPQDRVVRFMALYARRGGKGRRTVTRPNQTGRNRRRSDGRSVAPPGERRRIQKTTNFRQFVTFLPSTKYNASFIDHSFTARRRSVGRDPRRRRSPEGRMAPISAHPNLTRVKHKAVGAVYGSD